MAHQQESFLPFFFPSKSLLLPKPRGKKKHSKTSWSSLLSFRTVWYFHLLQNRMVYSLLRSRVVYSFLQRRMVSSPFSLVPPGLLFPSEPHGLLFSPPKPCGPPLLWLLGLGLNPSTHLPLQPHFLLLLQSVTPASIPVFFQLFWAAIVSLGMCGPMAWNQSSPSSHTGPVTRGSCFPVPSWVEATPISLTQSRATAI